MPVSSKLSMFRAFNLEFSALLEAEQALGLSGGRGVVVGNGPLGFGLEFFDNEGNPGSDVTTAVAQRGIGVAELDNGNLVLAYSDRDTGNFVYEFRSATDGTVIGSSFTITETNGTDARVAALKEGGFVIVTTNFPALSNSDVKLRIFAEDGTQVGATINVATSALAEDGPEVVVLDNGNIAVAWHVENAGETEVMVAVYGANGSVIRAPSVLDTIGSINESVAMTATDDGFAIVYEDNGWDLTSNATDLTLTTFDVSGNTIAETQLTATPARETGPSVTRMDGNVLALGWTVGPETDTNAVLTLFDLTTGTEGPRRQLTGGADDTDVALDVSLSSVGGSILTGVYTNDTDAGVNGEVLGVVRVFTGTPGTNLTEATVLFDRFMFSKGNDDTVSYANTSTAVSVSLLKGQIGLGGALGDTYIGVEKLIGTRFGDQITGSNKKNRLDGGEGSDVLNGAKGADVLIGGLGSDTLTGGKGNDVFVFNKGKDTITDLNFRRDDIQLDDSLWRGTLSIDRVVDRFGEVVGDDIVLDFKRGNVLTVFGLDDLGQLKTALDIV
jgi:hypothetical protein